MSGNGYDFYLDKCLLPITPSKLQLKINNNNSTMTLINEGEINILKTAKLTDIDFECILPQFGYPFVKASNAPAYYLDYFEKLKTSKKPFQFIVSRSLPRGGSLFSTNIKVSLEDYRITEDVKNGFDLTVKISLKQYRDYGTKTVAIKTTGNAVQQTSRAASTVQSSKPVGIGSDVIVNGRLHGTSYGDAPGQMRTNYRGKVNFINLKGSHPYHITTPQGLWQGWVTKESVKAV